MTKITGGQSTHNSSSVAELRLAVVIHEFFMEKGFVPHRGFVRCLAEEIAQVIPSLEGESASAGNLERKP
jgi:hypothetical protein